MAAGGPKQIINAAAAYTPLRFGLLSAAQEIPDPDDHWRNGTIVRNDICAPARATSDACPPATGSPKVPTVTGASQGVSAAEPFTVVAWLPCSAIGQPTAELRARTERALDRGEGRAVEQVFWTGQAGAYEVRPHLAEDTAVTITEGAFTGVELQTAATVVTGSATDVVEAIGLLEGALASCYGGEGVIHVPRAALAHLAAHNQLVVQGPQLRTAYGGNLVAAYASNNRHGPTGAEVAGLAWFYATGAVWYRRGAATRTGVRDGDYVDREANDTVYITERTYVVDWDCSCHLAAQVTLGGV